VLKASHAQGGICADHTPGVLERKGLVEAGHWALAQSPGAAGAWHDRAVEVQPAQRREQHPLGQIAGGLKLAINQR